MEERFSKKNKRFLCKKVEMIWKKGHGQKVATKELAQ